MTGQDRLLPCDRLRWRRAGGALPWWVTAAAALLEPGGRTRPIADRAVLRAAGTGIVALSVVAVRARRT